MGEYYIVCGASAIYAGMLNKEKNIWDKKSEVTDEVLESAAQYLLFNNKEFLFNFNGKEYVMSVSKQED